jgi:hypothetical protein
MKLINYIFKLLENWNRKQFLKANLLYKKKLEKLKEDRINGLD